MLVLNHKAVPVSAYLHDILHEYSSGLFILEEELIDLCGIRLILGIHDALPDLYAALVEHLEVPCEHDLHRFKHAAIHAQSFLVRYLQAHLIYNYLII